MPGSDAEPEAEVSDAQEQAEEKEAGEGLPVFEVSDRRGWIGVAREGMGSGWTTRRPSSTGPRSARWR
ncbi:hypothetical protein SMICM304S_03561 [Streptomyces microflavus]